MTFEMVSSVLLFGVILVAQQNHVASSWTSSLSDIWHKVEKGAKDVVSGAEKAMEEAKEKSDKYLKYGLLITQIQTSIVTGHFSLVKDKLNTFFKQLPADEQKEFIRQIKQFAEKERAQHYITKFLGRLADYLEKRQKTMIDQAFTDWFVNEIEGLLEVDSTSIGWVMKYGSGFLSDIDVWFLKLPSDNQTNIIENLKKLSETEEVENSITMLFDKIVERLEKIRNEK